MRRNHWLYKSLQVPSRLMQNLIFLSGVVKYLVMSQEFIYRVYTQRVFKLAQKEVNIFLGICVNFANSGSISMRSIGKAHH